MDKKSIEWLRQAEYDMETADYMYSGQRYFYAVFMCHLAVEKALKGLYQQNLKEVPPKTHNLIYLLDKLGLRPDEALGKTIVRLNEANIATRYPEDVDQLMSRFTEAVTGQLLTQAKEILEWIKKQF